MVEVHTTDDGKRMRGMRREQRAVRRVGPDDRKPLLKAAALADRLTK